MSLRINTSCQTSCGIRCCLGRTALAENDPRMALALKRVGKKADGRGFLALFSQFLRLSSKSSSKVTSTL